MIKLLKDQIYLSPLFYGYIDLHAHELLVVNALVKTQGYRCYLVVFVVFGI